MAETIAAFGSEVIRLRRSLGVRTSSGATVYVSGHARTHR